jgi:hypothetical protein
MKFRFPKFAFLALAVVAIAGCSESQKPQGQVVLVTAANETAAMTRLHAIAAAEGQYQVASGGEYGTLAQLIEKHFVNDPSSGKLTGYTFDVQVKLGGFAATAVPVQSGISGTRSFYVDETNVMRAAAKHGAPATVSDPEV